MNIGKTRPFLLLLILLIRPAGASPLFDVHLHYTQADAEHLSPGQVIERLKASNVERAVVIGQPPELAVRLYREDPGRIVPFLGVYRSRADKTRWMRDETLPERVSKALAEERWRGIGELHIFAENRHSPVFRRLIRLAREHNLIMMLHADPAVIDALYELAPEQPVIWAHAGAYPFPPLLEDYLERYPALYIDLSVRNERIAPQGELSGQWFNLFERHSDRILLGVDTFSTNRWREFDRVVAATRYWLEQLPPDTAENLAYRNARRLFGIDN